MKGKIFFIASVLVLLTFLTITTGARMATAATAGELNSAAISALEQLKAKSPAARDLSQRAVAILVFPGIYKVGFVVRGWVGEGVLLVNGRPEGYTGPPGKSMVFRSGTEVRLRADVHDEESP